METWLLLYKYKCPGNETLKFDFSQVFLYYKIEIYMILLCFSYFPKGEDVDYNSDNEDHDDEDEICDGCNLWYHSPCVLRKWPKNIPSNNKKKKSFCCRS